jgi:hypothetical protein
MLAPPLKNALLRFLSKPGSFSVKLWNFRGLCIPSFGEWILLADDHAA